MDPVRKAQVFEIAQRMNELNEEISRLCHEEGSSRRVATLLNVQSRLEKHIDFVHAVTTDEPLSDLVVTIKMPPDDEPVRLKAVWDKEAEGFHITNVPIELAPIVKAINAEIGPRRGSGTVQFSWDAVPEDLLHLLD